MWACLPLRSLVDMQRKQAVVDAGEHARLLLADGYAVEADRVLDEIGERIRSWEQEQAA